MERRAAFIEDCRQSKAELAESTTETDNTRDIRVPHKGNVVQNVINGAFDVLDGFDLIREQKDGTRAVELNRDEQHAFARSALALRYYPIDVEAPAPITDSQLLAPRRFEDRRNDLWIGIQPRTGKPN